MNAHVDNAAPVIPGTPSSFQPASMRAVKEMVLRAAEQSAEDSRCILSIDLERALVRSGTMPADWTAERTRLACRNYVRFLLLVALFPGQPHAPTSDIDVIWHLHMLAPKAYHADCIRLFGVILDHDGGFGRDAAEEPQLRATFGATAALWQEVYGEPYVCASTDGCTKCWHDCQGRCWHACSTKRASVGRHDYVLA
jgi:hypothetical protein